MSHAPYTLAAFVDDLRRVTSETRDERAILARVRPLAQRAAMDRTWLEPRLYTADPAQGWGTTVLHEEPDHTLFVAALAWLPGRGTPPHDHGTWAVVVAVDGTELNTFYERVDDRSRPGYAELRAIGRKRCAPGDVIAMPGDHIHAVRNDGEAMTLSFHVYGMNFNLTGRSQFDPEARTVTPFVVPTHR